MVLLENIEFLEILIILVYVAVLAFNAGVAPTATIYSDSLHERFGYLVIHNLSD